MTDKPKLTVIDGDRAARELEALLNFPKDFDAFIAFARTLAPAANGTLALVDTPADGENKNEPQ